jgi:phage tail-like protein
VYLDNIRLRSLSGDNVLGLCNRLPAPAIPAWLECINETSYTVLEGQQVVIAYSLTPGDSLTPITVTFSAATLTTADALVLFQAALVSVPELTASAACEASRIRINGGLWLQISEPVPVGATSSWTPTFGFPTDRADEIIASASSQAAIYATAYNLGSDEDFVVDDITVTADAVATSVYPVTPSGWVVDVEDGQSPGSTVIDLKHIAASRSAAFTSGTQVAVAVTLHSTTTPGPVVVSYAFNIEDDLAPSIVSVEVLDTKTLRVKFSEPMLLSSSNPRSPLFVKNIAGYVAFYAARTEGGTTYTNLIEAPVAEFSAVDHEGLFVAIRKANSAINDGCYEILSIVSNSLAKLDATLEDEEVADATSDEVPPEVYLAPFRIRRNPPSSEIKPIFEPHVIEARAVEEGMLVLTEGESLTQYVDLFLDDDLTFDADYYLDVVKLSDLVENTVSATASFSSWSYAEVSNNREFSFWDQLTAQYNKDIDKNRDLERFIRCLDECLQILFYDVDQFAYLLDPFRVKEAAIDTLLWHLGNPFSFAQGLSTFRKRNLAAMLVPTYKRKGTNPAIENMILSFLGKEVTVIAAENDSDTWILGEGILGQTTYVGPSASAVRYSFWLQPAIGVTLSDDEKTIIDEIVARLKPSHTHFLGYR